MSDERRYDESEVERIFQLATEAGEASPRASTGGTGTGMTLSELQEIGVEVGLPKEVVARAAASLEATPSGGKLTAMGLPIGTQRTVPLSRPLTDTEWERLVARCRQIFNARGKVEVMGSLREWSNGNLRVSVEPTDGGHQLAMKTIKGSLRPTLSMSAALLGIAVILVVVGVVSGRPVDLAGVAFMALVGLGVGGASLVSLPGWASLRSRQMDELAETVTDWTALPAGDGNE